MLAAYAVNTPGIGIAKIAEGSTETNTPFEYQLSRTATPRSTALAAHPQGFGLTWLEPVNGVDEVFFQFIGCVQ